MKKMFAVFLAGIFVFSQAAFAFEYDAPLVDQIEDYAGTSVNLAGHLELSKIDSRILALDISPNYTNDKLMYLSTGDGVYVNRSFNANFQKDAALSEYFPDGFVKMQYEGNYKDTGMILVHAKDRIFISYNYGNSWSEVDFAIEEEIVEADFGPNFVTNRQVYVVTQNGFYRKSLTSGNIEKLLTAGTAGELKNFRYVRTQPADNVFFIVKGNKLLKTENFASTWVETPFTTNILDFEIKQTTLSEGTLLVLTEDSKIYSSNWAISFVNLALPAEITTVYAVDYLILTNAGFYITYNNGNTWNKLNYAGLNPLLVSDYDVALDGAQNLLFATYDNILQRDWNFSESFSEYMTGIQLETVYAPAGEAVSKEILTAADMQFGEGYMVTTATIHADGDLNGQTMDFYMTADGENWEKAVAGIQHRFINPGSELYWKVAMATQNNSVSPVLRSVSINYGVDEVIGCAGFPDVLVDDSHCPAIQYVKAQGIFSGYPDGTFMPEQPIVRAETVKVIVEGFDVLIKQDDGTNLGFSDVIIGEWYMKYLRTAKDNGIIEGYPDGTFKPANTVNYVEMLKIFFETAGVELASAAQGEEWYQPYLDYANANNLVPYEDVSTGMKRVDVAELFYQWSLL